MMDWIRTLLGSFSGNKKRRITFEDDPTQEKKRGEVEEDPFRANNEDTGIKRQEGATREGWR